MTMTEIPNMPGLSTGDGYFERGYFTGDTDFPKVRVRFTPVQTTPAVADSMNIAAAPIAVVVAMSVALVDDAGAVLHVVPGRGLVFDARSHTWQSNNTSPLIQLRGCSPMSSPTPPMRSSGRKG
jgi:hypothetical protein